MLAAEATGQTNVLNLLLLSASTLIALNITRRGMEDYTMFVSRSEVILQSHSMADPTKSSQAEEMKGKVMI